MLVVYEDNDSDYGVGCGECETYDYQIILGVKVGGSMEGCQNCVFPYLFTLQNNKALTKKKKIRTTKLKTYYHFCSCLDERCFCIVTSVLSVFDGKILLIPL